MVFLIFLSFAINTNQAVTSPDVDGSSIFSKERFHILNYCLLFGCAYRKSKANDSIGLYRRCPLVCNNTHTCIRVGVPLSWVRLSVDKVLLSLVSYLAGVKTERHRFISCNSCRCWITHRENVIIVRPAALPEHNETLQSILVRLLFHRSSTGATGA